LNCAGSCGVAGIGADWIALLESCGAGSKCGGVIQFQNLQTGQAELDPRNQATSVDLSSPTLTARACAPLTVPKGDVDGAWGTLTPDDGFTIAAGDAGAYLERCGSKLHQFLTHTPNLDACPVGPCAPPSNSHVVIWQSAYGRLGGIFLPSRQRFSIPVPASVEPPGAAPGGFANSDGVTLALTSSTVYLEYENGPIWTTPTPSPPTRRKPNHS
jgi:hypothetical protein